MTDLELQQQLRSWYRQDVGDEHAPERLFATLPEITRADRPGLLLGRRAMVLLAAVLLLAAALAGAVGSGLLRLPVPFPDPRTMTWTPVGAMIEERFSHTATVLPNGKVLVAGGNMVDSNSGDIAGSAVLFDPSSNSWTPADAMSNARTGHTETLLRDGRVLVTGGIGDAGAFTAEIYDPLTGAWTAAGPMTEARGYATATLLLDGRVLVAGGQQDEVSRTAELFDPAHGSWTATGNMAVPRTVDAAALLRDGRVLVAGGAFDNQLARPRLAASAEAYDPASGAWKLTAPMNAVRVGHTATALADGRVLVTGGNDYEYESNTTGSPLRSAELYDATTDRWTATEPMSGARDYHTATLLPDGTVLVTGGSFNGGTGMASTELFDPLTGHWSPGPEMAYHRYYHTANLLQDGSVLVIGGIAYSGEDSSGLIPPKSGDFPSPFPELLRP